MDLASVLAAAIKAEDIAEVHIVSSGELHVVRTEGEEYTIAITWTGGLHPDRDEAGDALARAEFARLAEARSA